MPNRVFLFFFTLGWSAITCLFLIFIGYGLFQQLRTRSFDRTTGTIDSIARTTEPDEGGTNFGVAVTYHYRIGNQEYRASRLRYLAGGATDNWAGQQVAAFPKGANVTVYYDPRDPSQAVLIRGLEGFDLLLAQFATPFALGMIGLWIASAKSLAGPRDVTASMPDAAGSPLPTWLPLRVALITLAFAAFLGIFPVVFLFNGFHPPMIVAQLSWAVILLLCVVSAIITRIYMRKDKGPAPNLYAALTPKAIPYPDNQEKS